MPSPCKRCAATRLINLDTAHRIGVVSGCLVGGAIGAFRAAAANQTLSLATARFPLATLPAATIGAVTGGQSGVRVTSSLFAQWLPPGIGTPWLCLACGHTFRQSYPPLAADLPVVDTTNTVDERIIVEPPRTISLQRGVRESHAHYSVHPPQKRDYLARETRNCELGLAGENLVIRFEQHRLIKAGKEKLAECVEHVAITQGDGLGFDIRSFEPDGRDRLIEVKTTAFAKESVFFITPNELDCSRVHSEHYHLFRLFNFRKGPKLFCLKGDLREQLWLEPDSYRAGVR